MIAAIWGIERPGSLRIQVSLRQPERFPTLILNTILIPLASTPASHELFMPDPHHAQAAALVAKSQQIVAHAWMVRAFLRHSAEMEDFPELQEIGRAIFDLARALETRVDDPAGYLKMLGKKLAKFRTAVNEFAGQVPSISTHTNFAMGVISLQACVQDFSHILDQSKSLPPLPSTESSLPDQEDE